MESKTNSGPARMTGWVLGLLILGGGIVTQIHSFGLAIVLMILGMYGLPFVSIFLARQQSHAARSGESWPIYRILLAVLGGAALLAGGIALTRSVLRDTGVGARSWELPHSIDRFFTDAFLDDFLLSWPLSSTLIMFFVILFFSKQVVWGAPAYWESLEDKSKRMRGFFLLIGPIFMPFAFLWYLPFVFDWGVWGTVFFTALCTLVLPTLTLQYVIYYRNLL